jgi:hypothetical protein
MRLFNLGTQEQRVIVSSKHYRKKEKCMRFLFEVYVWILVAGQVGLYVAESIDIEFRLVWVNRPLVYLIEVLIYGWSLAILVVTALTTYCLIKRYRHFEYMQSKNAMISFFAASLFLVVIHGMMSLFLYMKQM